MAFCVKRRESVNKAVRRIGCERVENALEALDRSERPDAVHCARKEIKQVRALLRLARGKIGSKKYRRQVKLLRQAADYLGPVRDAYVRLQALKKVASLSGRNVEARSFDFLRRKLQRDFKRRIGRFSKQKITARVGKCLRRLSKNVSRIEVSGKGWKTIGSGISESYEQGRAQFQKARARPSPENLHEWRKRAKDLWYQVRLLRQIWPEQMDAVAAELRNLTETLGEDHDLFLLEDTLLHRSAIRGQWREAKELLDLIETRQGELRSTALAIGRRFYSEKPGVFANRLRGYWRIWRGKSKVSAKAAGDFV